MSLRCTHGEDKALECRGRVVGEGRAIQRRDSEDTGGIAQDDLQQEAVAREKSGVHPKRQRVKGKPGGGGGGVIPEAEGRLPRGRVRLQRNQRGDDRKRSSGFRNVKAIGGRGRCAPRGEADSRS